MMHGVTPQTKHTLSNSNQVMYVGVVSLQSRSETIAEINPTQCASWAYKGRLVTG
jgi:hypothetical protein